MGEVLGSQVSRYALAENELTLTTNPFNFESHDVRVLINERTGEPWFVGKDVAEILGYRDSRDATRYLDDDEKRTDSLTPPKQRGLTNSRNTNVSLINESGLYSLVLRSRMPDAKRFRKWVTSEILPSIRKTGSYSKTTTLPDFSDPVAMARAWADAKEAEQKAVADKLASPNIAAVMISITYISRKPEPPQNQGLPIIRNHPQIPYGLFLPLPSAASVLP